MYHHFQRIRGTGAGLVSDCLIQCLVDRAQAIYLLLWALQSVFSDLTLFSLVLSFQDFVRVLGRLELEQILLFYQLVKLLVGVVLVLPGKVFHILQSHSLLYLWVVWVYPLVFVLAVDVELLHVLFLVPLLLPQHALPVQLPLLQLLLVPLGFHRYPGRRGHRHLVLARCFLRSRLRAPSGVLPYFAQFLLEVFLLLGASLQIQVCLHLLHMLGAHVGEVSLEHVVLACGVLEVSVLKDLLLVVEPALQFIEGGLDLAAQVYDILLQAPVLLVVPAYFDRRLLVDDDNVPAVVYMRIVAVFDPAVLLGLLSFFQVGDRKVIALVLIVIGLILLLIMLQHVFRV